jgi:hypothetical protein
LSASPDVAVAGAEAIEDVAGDVVVRQSLKAHRHRRPVERAILVLEELLHERRLRAREDVRGDLALVLDMAAKQAVEIGHFFDVLELVERDERAVATALLETQGQIQQRVERRQGVDPRVELQSRADSVGAERQPDAAPLEEALDLRPQRSLELPRVGALEADGDVGDRGCTVEIDEDGD